MNLVENIKEGFRSVSANLLRTILTAFIVALGITALVGVLTAIDGIQYSINDSLSDLGVNTFDIKSKRNRRNRTQGMTSKVYSPIRYKEAQRFVGRYDNTKTVSLTTTVTQTAEIKRLSEKTDPNVWILGANEHHVPLAGLNLKSGRNFSRIEIQYGSNVAILGEDIVKALFKKKESPINDEISILGSKFKIIGVLEKKGSMEGDRSDNSVIVPLINANKLGAGKAMYYNLKVEVSDPLQMDFAMGEATGIMRSIRRDRIGGENSFDVTKSETLAETMEGIASKVRIGGFAIGFVTLLGASIALMNIMMVSVTERTREVGVRKALGATPLRIRQQFIIEAIVVCLLGGVMGIILGITAGNLVSILFTKGSFVLPWLWMSIAFIVCIVVGLFSGYYPAYKASKLDPIESLRFE